MKLSDAIDEGSLLKPQAFRHSTPGYACALEGAALALGKEKKDWCNLHYMYPWSLKRDGKCPTCGHVDDYLSLIWHLNDRHHMPRPEIAAWVRTVEPIEDAQPAIQPAEAAVLG